MNKPNLLVLGGSASQVPLILRAKSMGFIVGVADQNPLAPGNELADYCIQASTFDSVAIIPHAKKWGTMAVGCIGSDQPVHTAAVIAQALGLPNPLDVNTALGVTNKAIMKPKLSREFLDTQAYVILSKNPDTWDWASIKKLHPPWVMKPVDSQGQRGIALVNSPEELLTHLPTTLNYSREKRLLLEEFYPSREVTLSGWANNPGDWNLWTISDRITFPPKSSTASLGVCFAHRYPSQFARGWEDEIYSVTGKIVETFGLSNTPLYFQFLIGSQGVRVNEIACRLGGAYEDQWIPLVTGIDILDQYLGWFSTQLGHVTPNTVEKKKTKYRAIVIPLLFANPGRVWEYQGFDTLTSIPGVHSCTPLLPIGTEILPMTNSTQRIAYVILGGQTSKEVNHLIDLCFDTLKIYDKYRNNLLRDTRVETYLDSGI